jgi:hypothetical protein
MTSTLPQREAVARIIDPDAWELVCLMGEEPFLLGPWSGRRDVSLSKADQIISSLQDRWRPIETHDGSNKPVFICSGENVGEAYFRSIDDEDDGWWWANTTWGDYPYPDRPQPSLWMPLPPIPSSLKGSDVGEVGE